MKSAFLSAAMVAVGICHAEAASAAPDPTDPKAAVAPLKYQSPFRDYRALGEDKRVPWKDANDEVARIGGWRAYAKEAQQAAPDTPAVSAPSVAAPQGTPPSPPPATATPPAAPKPMPGHAGHGNK